LYFAEPERLISAIVNIIFYVNSVSRRLKKLGVDRMLLVAGCLLLVGNTLFGQSAGDYGTRFTDGLPYAWSTGSNWLIYPGSGGWGAATVAGAPPTNGINRVWIRTN
jgi:hypothetical protein